MTDFETIAQLPPVNPFYGLFYWEILNKKGNEILLEERFSPNPSEQPTRYLLVKSDGSVAMFNSEQNPLTGETVIKGAILVGEEDQYEIPTLSIQIPGDAPIPLLLGTEVPEINKITLARPENRKIAFLSEDHGALESYAVFLASESGVLPIVLPNTILPDGGLIWRIPRELMLSDGTVVFRSSTTMSSSQPIWFFKFPNQPLRLGLGVGSVVPGEIQAITALGRMVSVDQSRARYYVEAAGLSYLVETSSLGMHQVIARSNAIGSGMPLPGCGVRITSGAMWSLDASTGYSYYAARVNADELQDVYGSTLVCKDGVFKTLHAEPQKLAGFGQNIALAPRFADEGWFYATLTSGGNQFLVKGRSSFSAPTPRISELLREPDGSIRFTADFLTLDQSYDVECSATLNGPWTTCKSFTPGSISRSIPAPAFAGGRGFYRLKYVK
jgi:hypothetical protein